MASDVLKECVMASTTALQSSVNHHHHHNNNNSIKYPSTYATLASAATTTITDSKNRHNNNDNNNKILRLSTEKTTTTTRIWKKKNDVKKHCAITNDNIFDNCGYDCFDNLSPKTIVVNNNKNDNDDILNNNTSLPINRPKDIFNFKKKQSTNNYTDNQKSSPSSLFYDSDSLSSQSNYHHHHQQHRPSSGYQRMTANNNIDLFQQHHQPNKTKSKGEDGGGIVSGGGGGEKSHLKNSSSNPTRIISQRNNANLSHESIMNLRNRPLKAATAGTDSNTNPSSNDNNTNASHDISSAKLLSSSTSTTTTITSRKKSTTDNTNNNKNSGSISSVRRRSRRHQQSQQSAVSSSLHHCQDYSLSPSKQHETASLPTSTRSVRSFFPLRTIGNVCELFRYQIDPQFSGDCASFLSDHDDFIAQNNNHQEPDLALLSIVIGLIETSLTRGLYEDDANHLTENIENVNKLGTENGATKKIDNNDSPSSSSSPPPQPTSSSSCHHPTTNISNSAGSYSPAEATTAPIVPVSNEIHSILDIPIPTVYYENVESLLKKFNNHIKESIDLSKYPKKPTTIELIKKISEVIWSNLHRSHYKDRAHLQTIFNYLTENRLDCYGVAYTVLAACQILGLDDVRLVMSEDHAWVIFGEDETCEVTWHGKSGNDDRCGQPIPENLNCWLYLNGNTMTCDTFMVVATLVSSMNLAINATQDSEELAILQQQLLWILYEYGYLKKYPMALGNLGDLEDVCLRVTSKKHPLELFQEAIESAKTYYNDYHVYPYTYIGGYYFRNGRFKEAFKSWAEAAQVIKKYNYTRDDEEIYKEFQEIANDLIPYIVKHSSPNETNSVLQDPECFVHLLRFYDGLCAWEEDSSTPVLHIGWTKPIVSTISKFPYTTRSQVTIKVRHQLLEKEFMMDQEDEDSENNVHRERRRRRAASIGSITSLTGNPLEKNVENLAKEKLENGKHIPCKIEDSQKIDVDSQSLVESGKIKRRKLLDKDDCNRTDFDHKNQQDENHAHDDDNNNNNDDDHDHSKCAILISKKFTGIRNLLTADKLNTSAIQLQLTAQSQVNINNKRNRNGTFHQ